MGWGAECRDRNPASWMGPWLLREKTWASAVLHGQPCPDGPSFSPGPTGTPTARLCVHGLQSSRLKGLRDPGRFSHEEWRAPRTSRGPTEIKAPTEPGPSLHLWLGTGWPLGVGLGRAAGMGRCICQAGEEQDREQEGKLRQRRGADRGLPASPGLTQPLSCPPSPGVGPSLPARPTEARPAHSRRPGAPGKAALANPECPVCSSPACSGAQGGGGTVLEERHLRG